MTQIANEQILLDVKDKLLHDFEVAFSNFGKSMYTRCGMVFVHQHLNKALERLIGKILE